MTSSAPIIKPQFLTAAALAWTVFHQAESVPKIVEDDDDFADSIPEIESPPFVVKKHAFQTPNKRTVVPIMIPTSQGSDVSSIASLSPRPTKARVSAATMRNLQSRRRARTAMEQYKQNNQVPKIITTATRDSPISVAPPSAIHCVEPALIRFKVRSSTNAVVRFQCEPMYEQVQQNIQERLGVTEFRITFKDDDGDMCVMSDDEDVQDAIAGADGDLVRLDVEEVSKSLFQAISLKFKW